MRRPMPLAAPVIRTVCDAMATRGSSSDAAVDGRRLCGLLATFDHGLGGGLVDGRLHGLLEDGEQGLRGDGAQPLEGQPDAVPLVGGAAALLERSPDMGDE